MIPIKGCPPAPQSILKALRKAGIDVDAEIFEQIEKALLRFMKRYEGKPEFDESFYTVS
jgi:coenzyme F420-reducing hydrogenase gamma subunit